MTDLRQAAEQALDILEGNFPVLVPEDRSWQTIEALRAALEQPQPAAQAEPVRSLVRLDEQYRKALSLAIDAGRASVSMIQRRLCIGYGEAQALVVRMVRDGYIGIEDTPGVPSEVLAAAPAQAEPQGERIAAIEACPYDTSPESDYWIEGWQAARAALEQPKAEPVAWVLTADLDNMRYSGLAEVASSRDAFSHKLAVTPLYAAAPAQAEPLTYEEIVDAVREADLDWHRGWSLDEDAPNRFVSLARAIERAHGIQDTK